MFWLHHNKNLKNKDKLKPPSGVLLPIYHSSTPCWSGCHQMHLDFFAALQGQLQMFSVVSFVLLSCLLLFVVVCLFKYRTSKYSLQELLSWSHQLLFAKYTSSLGKGKVGFGDTVTLSWGEPFRERKTYRRDREPRDLSTIHKAHMYPIFTKVVYFFQ